jgi:hypothetical protein
LGWGLAFAAFLQPCLEAPFAVHVGGDQREQARREVHEAKEAHRERRTAAAEQSAGRPTLADVIYGADERPRAS